MRWNGTAPATLGRYAALLHPRARVISFSQVGWHWSVEPDPNPAVGVVSSDSDSEDAVEPDDVLVGEFEADQVRIRLDGHRDGVTRVASARADVAGTHNAAALDRYAA